MSSNGYQRAINELSEIPKTSKLYGKAQSLIQRWNSQIGAVKQLEEAQLKALSGSPQDLLDAIAMAQRISKRSDKWREARENIQDWSNQLERSEDQPILDLADELSLPGDERALRAAIVQAQKIGPSRLMFDEAQSRISYWRSRLNDFSTYQIPEPSFDDSSDFQSPVFNDFESSDPFPESTIEPVEPSPPVARESVEPDLMTQAQNLANQGTPDSLQSAISTANQVPLGSNVRAQADSAIENWSNQLLSQAVNQAEIDPQAAIAIAQLIPGYSQMYGEAQTLIKNLTEPETTE